MEFRLTGDKLPEGVNMSVNGCLSICDSPVIWAPTPRHPVNGYIKDGWMDGWMQRLVERKNKCSHQYYLSCLVNYDKM